MILTLDRLQPGDAVQTHSGMIGNVVQVYQDHVVVDFHGLVLSFDRHDIHILDKLNIWSD